MHTPRVLLADGNLELRRALRRRLLDAHPGALISESADGLSAFAQFTRGQFDLVVLGSNLQRRSGLTLVQIICDLPLRLKPAHVLLLCEHQLEPASLRHIDNIRVDFLLRHEPLSRFDEYLRAQASDLGDRREESRTFTVVRANVRVGLA